MSSTDGIIVMCANCGKGEEGAIDLKFCTACKMVKYCNRDCQIAHRPQHKKACKKQAAELHDEQLFKEPQPPDECPICCLPLPINLKELSFKTCCGNVICNGCTNAMIDEAVRRGKKNVEEAIICAFCRTPVETSDEEAIRRMNNLIGSSNGDAINAFGGRYAYGTHDVQQDITKANELYLRAGELGCAQGYNNLAQSYGNGRGVNIDKKKGKYYFELAAMNGDVDARVRLFGIEGKAGNRDRAMKHILMAARAGDNEALEKVKEGFMRGIFSKEEYGISLRAYHKRTEEAKSVEREKAIAKEQMVDMIESFGESLGI